MGLPGERDRLTRRPVVLLVTLAVLAAVAAVAADHVAFPLAPAFPFLHLGVSSFTIWDGDEQFLVADTARVVAWVAAASCVLCGAAALVVAVQQRARRRGRPGG